MALTSADVDGKAYIDYVGSWGPMVLGHNHPAIRNAVIEAASRGPELWRADRNGSENGGPGDRAGADHGYGADGELRYRSHHERHSPARGFTGRDKIIKFEGCYHGHADCLLVKAGSGALTLGQPNSPGVPADFAKHTLTCTYNDLASVRAAFEQYPQGDRLHHRRAGGRKYELHSAAAGIPCRACAPCATNLAPC